MPKSGGTVTYGVTLTNGKHAVDTGKYLVLELTGETAAAGTMSCTAGTASSTTTAVQLTGGFAADATISCHFGVLVDSAHAINGQIGAFNVTAVFASNQDGSGNLGDAYYIPSGVQMDPVTVNTGAVLSAASSEVVATSNTYYTGMEVVVQLCSAPALIKYSCPILLLTLIGPCLLVAGCKRELKRHGHS